MAVERKMSEPPKSSEREPRVQRAPRADLFRPPPPDRPLAEAPVRGATVVPKAPPPRAEPGSEAQVRPRRRVALATKLLVGHLVVITVCFVVPAIVEWLYPDRSGTSLIAVRVASVFLGILVASLVSLVLSRSMTRNVEVLSRSADRISGGDLSSLVRLDRGVSFADETDRLAESVNRMVTNLRELVWHIQATSAGLAKSAGRLGDAVQGISTASDGVARSVDQIARGAELQAELVEKSRGSIDHMAALTKQIGGAAEDTSLAVRATANAAQIGAESARLAVEKIRLVFEKIERASAMVIEFGARSREIRQFVNVVTHVAQETHLLALNATIEAAKAGEAGRGFAVVADEVRKLAESTSGSGEQIARLVQSIGDETEKVVRSMREGIDDLASERAELGGILGALEKILASAMGSAEKVETISRIAHEQLRGADEMVKAIANMSQVTESHATSTGEVAAATEQQSASMAKVVGAADELGELSGQLEAVVSSFKV